MRGRGEAGPALVKLVTTLIASEVERLRAPERASEQALAGFLHALLDRDISGREDILGRAGELGLDLVEGASIVVARAHSHVPTEDGWRQRVLGGGRSRCARRRCPGPPPCWPRAPTRWARRSWSCCPAPTTRPPRAPPRRSCASCRARCPGTPSRWAAAAPAPDPVDLHRAGAEALLAANVAEGDADRPVLAFEESGAYRLLLSAMSEDPAELQRFYAETVEPLVAYDEQYETGLVQTVEAFLEADGNVAGTAQRLFTHRHTIRYRLERVKELSGLDVGSTDGREKLSLGLKAMRVLGIAHRGGPATEAGASGGRVPRRGLAPTRQVCAFSLRPTGISGQ